MKWSRWLSLNTANIPSKSWSPHFCTLSSQTRKRHYHFPIECSLEHCMSNFISRHFWRWFDGVGQFFRLQATILFVRYISAKTPKVPLRTISLSVLLSLLFLTQRISQNCHAILIYLMLQRWLALCWHFHYLLLLNYVGVLLTSPLVM